MPWISTRSIFSQARSLGFVLLEKPSTEFDMRLTSTIFTCRFPRQVSRAFERRTLMPLGSLARGRLLCSQSSRSWRWAPLSLCLPQPLCSSTSTRMLGPAPFASFEDLLCSVRGRTVGASSSFQEISLTPRRRARKTTLWRLESADELGSEVCARRCTRGEVEPGVFSASRCRSCRSTSLPDSRLRGWSFSLTPLIA